MGMTLHRILSGKGSDSDMLANKDKVDDWRNRRESFGHGMGGREVDKRVAN